MKTSDYIIKYSMLGKRPRRAMSEEGREATLPYELQIVGYANASDLTGQYLGGT